MVNLEEYFRVWKQRLKALKGYFGKINMLPDDAQVTQALIVRDSCLDFVAELELAFESILSDYVCRQDEFFLAAVDDIHLSAFNEKQCLNNSDLSAIIVGQKKDLVNNMKSLAVQAAEFEASILLAEEGYRRQAYVIIGQLAATYGISPHIQKKKPD